MATDDLGPAISEGEADARLIWRLEISTKEGRQIEMLINRVDGVDE